MSGRQGGSYFLAGREFYTVWQARFILSGRQGVLYCQAGREFYTAWQARFILSGRHATWTIYC